MALDPALADAAEHGSVEGVGAAGDVGLVLAGPVLAARQDTPGPCEGVGVNNDRVDDLAGVDPLPGVVPAQLVGGQRVQALAVGGLGGVGMRAAVPEPVAVKAAGLSGVSRVAVAGERDVTAIKTAAQAPPINDRAAAGPTTRS